MKVLTVLLFVVVSFVVSAQSRNYKAELEKLQKDYAKLEKKMNKLETLHSTKKKKSVNKSDARKIAKLEKEILYLGRSINNYQSRVRNAKFSIIKMERSDATGWSYKKSSVKYPMSTFPKKWNRRKIKIHYITKAQKIAKIKAGYLKTVAEKESKMKVLVAKLKKMKQ